MPLKIFRATTVVAMLMVVHPGFAGLKINFIEGAPKDQFLIANTAECDINDLVLHFDLSTSTGKLIFDTKDAGAGVEVFQPFEVRKGNLSLVSSETVEDGSDTLSVRIPSLRPGEQVSFTIDVDDTMVKSVLGKIRVTDAEIENGTIHAELSDAETASAVFDSNSTATLVLNTC